MVRKDGSFIKQSRIEEIRKMIAKGIKDGVNVDKLLTLIEVKIGLTRWKAREYVIAVLETSAGWSLDESKGMIVFVESKEEGSV